MAKGRRIMKTTSQLFIPDKNGTMLLGLHRHRIDEVGCVATYTNVGNDNVDGEYLVTVLPQSIPKPFPTLHLNIFEADR